MKKINLLCLFIISLNANAQFDNPENLVDEQNRLQNLMMVLSFDVIKTDRGDRIGNKIQSGLELNYFLKNNVSITAGTEVWTAEGRRISGVVGFRYYPLHKFFIRGRALIGLDDVTLGTGFSQIISERWAAEGVVDYFFQGEAAIRIGLSYLFTRKIYNKQL